MSVFSGKNLSCSKRDRLLFSDIAFNLNASEVLYIRGPNGAGKTSLLRILVGLSTPDSGELFFQQQPLREVSETFCQNLVYFGHKLGLNTYLNAIENLHAWCEQHNCPQSTQVIIDVLDQLGLVGLEDVPVGNLSAGQQRRVALARLWLKTDARLWILDEPFTALDVDGIALLRSKMKSELGKGASVVLTSHQALELDYPVTELVMEYQI